MDWILQSQLGRPWDSPRIDGWRPWVIWPNTPLLSGVLESKIFFLLDRFSPAYLAVKLSPFLVLCLLWLVVTVTQQPKPEHNDASLMAAKKWKLSDITAVNTEYKNQLTVNHYLIWPLPLMILLNQVVSKQYTWGNWRKLSNHLRLGYSLPVFISSLVTLKKGFLSLFESIFLYY